MAEPRFDPLGRRWVLLAPERARRPGSHTPSGVIDDPAPCDFCGGQEHRTPPETIRIPPPPGPWRVRGVPNAFAATRSHEVVVHGPDHDVRLESLPGGHRTELMQAWSSRLATFDAPARVAMVNRGREAGASRAHEHSQLLGLDVVPPVLEREAAAFAEDPCVACALATDDATVADIEGTAIVAHPAPLVPHELVVVPRHAPRFEEASGDALSAFGAAVAESLRRITVMMDGETAVNLVVHTAPREAQRFHWHAHLYPRIGTWGGLEIGTELPIVAADPAESARRYRAV